MRLIIANLGFGSTIATEKRSTSAFVRWKRKIRVLYTLQLDQLLMDRSEPTARPNWLQA